MTAQQEQQASPEHGRLNVMALAYIRAWLDEDYWTIARIELALEEAGATVHQVAETFSLAAAALLTEAHAGRSADASGHVSGRQDAAVARQARLRRAS